MPHLPSSLRPLAVSLILACVTAAGASVPGHVAVDQVSLNSYVDFLDNYLFTHTGDNRGPYGVDHDPARNNIKALFESYGLPTVLDSFTYSGSTYENVVATQLGTVHPEQIYIIGGHYDSVSNPGADDNASGIALVLEAARILSQYDSDATIVYIAFDMEEQGLIGSDHYADAHAADDIRGMVSADMVAYDTGSDYANVYGRTASSVIKALLADAILEYGIDLGVAVGGDEPFSDHAPFEALGFQACLLIEGEVWSNPFYHLSSDNFENPDNLNFTYAHKMVRSMVGFLVDVAGVNVPVDALSFSYPDGRPNFVGAQGTTTLRVAVQGVGTGVPAVNTGVLHYDAGAGWQSVPMTSVGGSEYLATFPAVSCGTELRYYVAARTASDAESADPYDAPVRFYTTIVADEQVLVVDEDFEADTGWSVSGDAADGQWQRAVPVDCDRGDPPVDYDGSGQCYVTDNGTLYDCNSDVDGGATVLTSPVYDLSVGGSISYAYWLNDIASGELGPEDALLVEVATDAAGTNWTLLREHFGAATEWRTDEILIGSEAPASATVRIRFTAQDQLPANVVEAGVDAVVVHEWSCTPGVLGDLNCSGAVDFFDIDPFVVALTGAANYANLYPDCDHNLADINGDGSVDFFDIDPFVVLLSTP